jgi:hypothetical protein
VTWGSGRAAVTKAIDLALQPIEQLARPEEFASQDRQRSKNRQPAGAGQGNHRDARREQQKTAGDLAVSEKDTHFFVRR